MVRIIGVDPGLQHCGWGIIESADNHLRYIASGTISPPAKQSLGERLAQIHAGLSRIVEEFKPQQAAIEETFVSVNGQSTLKLGHARGVALLALAQTGLPISEYAARLVKKTITGNGNADKNQMQHMIRHLLPLSSADSADAADALAIAVCHAHHPCSRQL